MDEFETLQMTREILATPGALEGIRQGARGIEEGRYRTLADARAVYRTTVTSMKVQLTSRP